MFFPKRKSWLWSIFASFIYVWSIGEHAIAAVTSAEVETYWHCFSLSQYLEGERQALKHLSRFSRHFPSAPLQIYVYLVLGYNAKRPDHGGVRWRAAAVYFAKGAATWMRLTAENAIPKDQEVKYRRLYWQALLEEGRCLIALADGCVHDEAKMAALMQGQKLFESLATTPLYGEALYELARSYVSGGEYEKAEKTLKRVLEEEYEDTKREKRRALAYSSLGQLAFDRGEIVAALSLFKEAEGLMIGGGDVELWLKQSQCLRRLGDNNGALALLSRVVNSHVVTSLRIRAMCLRAEIYKEQGKIAMAIKQLESVVKKGGHWKHYAETQLLLLTESS